MKRKWLNLILAFFLFLPTSVILSQEAVPITTRELTQRSQRIVLGEVIDQYSAWGDKGRLIYTYTTLRTNQVIKSVEADSIIVLRHLGGKVDNIELRVAGLPQFQMGEKTLVFLGPYPDTGYYGLIDWYQGKYTVREVNRTHILQGFGPGKGKTVEEFVTELRSYQ